MNEDFDAVVAAPASHIVLLENERVRVLRIVVAPGAAEPVHIHPWPSVLHVEAAQPLIYLSYTAGPGGLRETGRVRLMPRAEPRTEWLDPEGLHAVENVGSDAYLALRVELKPAGRDESD